MAQVKRQGYVRRKSLYVNRQVSVLKQDVSIHSFRYFEEILHVKHFMVNDFVFIANKVSDVSCKRQS